MNFETQYNQVSWSSMKGPMSYTVVTADSRRATKDRFFATISEFPGIGSYGETRVEAAERVEALVFSHVGSDTPITPLAAAAMKKMLMEPLIHFKDAARRMQLKLENV